MTGRRWLYAIPATIIAIILTTLLGSWTAAHAATVSSHPTFIMQNDDLANLRGVGVTGTFGYTLCNPGGQNPQELPCQPGQIPDFTTETAFAAWAATAKPYSHALFDDEGWAASDGEAATETVLLRYVELAGQVAVKYRIGLIEAPVSPAADMAAVDEAAAKAGAWGVDEQVQYNVGSKDYTPVVLADAAAIREGDPDTRVFAGLSTDAGGTPRTAFELIEDWNSVRTRVYGAWLNIPVWAPPAGKGCAAVNGCAVIGEGFLNYLDGVKS